MLTRFKLHNFRSYLNTEIEFHQRHLLIGPNNSGKSNLLFALQFLGGTSWLDLTIAANALPGGVASFTHAYYDSNQSEFEMEATIPFEQETLTFTYTLNLKLESTQDYSLGAVSLPKLRVTDERLEVGSTSFAAPTVLLRSDGKEAQLLHEEEHLQGRGEDAYRETSAPKDETMLSKLYDLPTNRRANLFKRFLGAIAYLTIAPTRARWEWATGEGQPIGLGVHAENLALMIYRLKNQDEKRYRRIMDRVREVEPNLEVINFHVAPDQQIIPFLHMKGNRKFAWPTLSDGTLRYLALAYVIEVSDQATESPGLPVPLVMVEEPDNGLYVGQLRTLVDTIEDECPEGQFIFTTHSPYLLDLFDNDLDAVSILRKSEDRTVITPLGRKRTEINKALEQMSLGEQYFHRTFFND